MNRSIELLSKLLLTPRDVASQGSRTNAELKREVRDLNRERFEDLLSLAQSHHVIVRGMTAMRNLMREIADIEQAEWAETALVAERARINNALTFLHSICAAFEETGQKLTVIKSLDHWPDIGSDLDLYTDASERDVFELMSSRFDAEVAPQSWGDRLAHKWNFNIPGLPEAVEVHVGRLGQTGEQVYLASALASRSRPAVIGGLGFHVPSSSDRIMISTLQRMYRHFYFRLCDVVDTAVLSDAGGIDFVNLCYLARRAGIWEGVATYLTIVSDYVASYRGSGLDLPNFVTTSARFRGDKAYYSRGFLRVPIMPQSVRLYGSQLARVLARGELHNGARLTLLPWLATAAVIGQKLTGSDKGIW
jgi:hypothetical protein